MESLQNALTHGFGVAARISYTVFKSAVLKALFIIDEKHLVLAIEQNVDLLPLFLIYAPQWVKVTQSLAGRAGRGYVSKITLETSLRWLREQCYRGKSGYYDIIVNVPDAELGTEPKPEDVYPPHGADMKRVMWFWNNVQRLLGFIFQGKMPESSRKWGVEHLRWLAAQKKGGKTKIHELLDEAHKQNDGVEGKKKRRKTK